MTDLDLDLISRCLAGRCTAWERICFERWLAESPDHLSVVEAVQAVAIDGDAPASREWKARATAALRARMAAGNGADVASLDGAREVRKWELEMHRSPSRWSRLVRWVAVGLAATVGIVGGRALLAPDTPPAEESVALRTVTTPPAQRAVFRLPDGTRVVLGVASTLRHPVDFAQSREVFLEGEAYFEVTHDARRPFVVRAGELVAEDLGTEFVVRAYPGEPNPHVVVREGRVELRSAADSAAARVVAPGELGRLDAGAPVVEPADTAAHFAWTEGVLVFARTPLREALPQLGRWYGLKFRLADTSLGSLPLSGSFELQLSDDALDALAATLGLRKVRRGRVVTLLR